MNRLIGFTQILSLIIFLTFSFLPNAFAEQTSVQKMAQILAKLNHRPTDVDKETLREISKNGTEVEKSIADALMNVDHTVRAADGEMLKKLSNDPLIPENTRELAEIMRNLKHYVSAGERETLTTMYSEDD
jgi:oligoendopeptidase F